MAITKITADVIDTGTITADNLHATLDLSSKTLTLPSAQTATTQSAGDNSTKVATTAYVETATAALVDSAPGTLNTLNELAAALGDDANFSTTVTNSIAAKLPLAGGSLTGALDITAGGNHLTLSRSGFDDIILGTGTVNSQDGFHITNTTDNTVPISLHENAPAATLVIDSTGNVGIGRVPESDYYSTLKALALGNGPVIYASTSGNPSLTFNDNLFINSAGNNEYQTSNPGTRLEQFNGTLTFSNAPSGTAGQTATLTERFRIASNGRVSIGTTSATELLNIAAGSSDGAGIEMAGNGTTIGSTSLFIGHGSTNLGYLWQRANSDLLIGTNNTERMRITSGGEVQITGTSGYELGFTGNNTINIRSDAGMFMLANTVHSDPYFGLGVGSNAWGQHIMMRTKNSSGTDGSATLYNAVSVGTTAGGSSLGSFNGPEPMAPFHILKGGLTMNGIETAGVTKYAHGNSDSGQWMHMNSAGRSGSGVGNFQLYIPTAVSSASWGAFGGDLFLSGYNGQHSYIIWRGYTNSGIVGASGSQVNGTGSPTITVGQNGTFGFYINVSNISMTHPVAMYRVCKGGNGGREWDLSEISCRWY